MAVPTRKTLEELGHYQPGSPVQMDNKTVEGLINNKIISKATKSINMKFHWLCYRGAQGQFRFFIGDQERETMGTTGPNTSSGPITKHSTQEYSRQGNTLMPFATHSKD